MEYLPKESEHCSYSGVNMLRILLVINVRGFSYSKYNLKSLNIELHVEILDVLFSKALYIFMYYLWQTFPFLNEEENRQSLMVARYSYADLVFRHFIHVVWFSFQDRAIRESSLVFFQVFYTDLPPQIQSLWILFCHFFLPAHPQNDKLPCFS